MKMRGLLVAAGCVALVVVGSAVAPARRGLAYVPATSAAVLGPARPRDPTRERMAARQRADPADVQLATALAEQLVRQARSRADPRALGQAQALLAPWWPLDRPPLEVTLLRATIRQGLHEFTAALADLEAVLHDSPRHSQALLAKASILVVVGEYAAARAACSLLVGYARPAVAAACASIVASLTGEAKRARSELEAAVAAEGPGLDDAARAWLDATLADVAERSGDLSAAAVSWEAVLRRDPGDVPALAAWADVMLASDRAADVAARLAPHSDTDALLLRLALAEAALRSPATDDHVRALAARFDASRARGDALHLREEARFRLHLAHDARGAVALASKNFASQREPWDVRLLLEAAEAGGARAAAAPALAFIAQTGFSERTVDPLAERLRRSGAP